jgi:hypothetical protein
MSHAMRYPPTPLERMSLEEHIAYVEANVEQLVADLMADESIPLRDREILADRMSRYRWEIENGVTWEEFEKELNQS